MPTNKLILAALLALFAAGANAQEPSTVISVDAARSPEPVNRFIFGHNLDAADNARIFSSDHTDPNSLRSASGFWNPDKRAVVPAILERARALGIGSLRYPGGSLVHNYDWRKAVGPLAARGDWKFGIDEYLAACRTIGAEPIFTVADYTLPIEEMPAHLAGLIEYLNAPATPDHPWAMKRKEWGHPEPYGVKYFELGNESSEGNMRVLPRREFSPAQYADYANAAAAAMRAVDPSIKLGLVMNPGPGTNVRDEWNCTVLREAGKSIDYLIVHLYGPDLGANASGPEFFQACMAVGEQSEKHLDEYRALARELTGRELPLAITEFNGPLSEIWASNRASYGVALECADLLRIFLQPEHHVLTANYWHFINGAFGVLRSDLSAPDGGKIKEEASYKLFRLWGEHLGARLAAVDIQGAPRTAFAGRGSVYPSEGDTYVPARSLGPVPLEGHMQIGQLKIGSVSGEGGDGGAFALRLTGVTGHLYPTLAQLPKPAGPDPCDYEVTYEARFIPDPGSETGPLGLGVGDARGWEATRSAIAIMGIGPEWKAFRGSYHAEPDTVAVNLQARLETGSAKVSGRMEVRGLRVEAVAFPRYPAYSLLTACATRSEDGKTLHLIVFNKSARRDIPARLRVSGFRAASARLSEVNGSALSALTGVAETVHDAPLAVNGTEATHVFPAHSMTAIDLIAQP